MPIGADKCCPNLERSESCRIGIIGGLRVRRPRRNIGRQRKNDACIAWEQADFIKMVLIRCLLVEHGSFNLPNFAP